MTKYELLEILKGYEDEERRSGFYSYTFANNNINIFRRSNPSVCYTIWKNSDVVTKNTLVPFENADEVLWFNDWDRILFEEIPDADDYQIGYGASYPYIGMIDIQKIEPDKSGRILCNGIYKPTNIDEERNNYIFLNNLKHYIDKCDYITHNNSSLLNSLANEMLVGMGVPIDVIRGRKEPDEHDELDKDLYYPNTWWCGIGSNEYTCNQFHFNNSEYMMCTASYINKINKARRHYKEREFRFPYISNGIDVNNAIYVQTSSLRFFKGNALKAKQADIKNDIKNILSACGVEEYKIIQINKIWKALKEDK